MGMDPVTIGLIGSAVVGGATSLLGAHSQQKTNNANLTAQQQQAEYMKQQVGQYLQPSSAVNPYANLINQFVQNQGKPGGAYQYQQPANSDFNYDPSLMATPPVTQAATVGGVPQISAPNMAGVDNMQAPNLGSAPTVGGVPQIGGTPQVSAQQIQMPGAINLPQVGAPTPVGTSGFNAGQDGLMQMMRRDVSGSRDASIDPMLQAGTQQFDNSALFGALAPQDKQLLDEQVNQLRGSAGSFGQRFGSAMMKQEGTLRGQFANNIAARNAGIQQQSFESAQGRNLQAAGTQAGREATFAQQPFQSAQLQQQAASTLGQLNQQQQGLDLQAQQFNVGQNQQAQQFNAQNAIQASLASQGIAAQLGQANASNDLQAQQQNAQLGFQGQQQNQNAALQAALANAGYQSQYGLQGAQLQQQAGMFNLGNQLQTQQQNAGYNMQGQQLNQQSALQAALANAGYQQQSGQFNAGNLFAQMQANQQAQNQAGQFNTGMNMQNNQFGAQQGNIQNQLAMSALMNAAGLQNQQQGQNISLLGLLGGIGVPQQQVNPMYGAIGDVSQQAMMMPMLMQMMQQGGSPNRAPAYMPQIQPFGLPQQLQTLGNPQLRMTP